MDLRAVLFPALALTLACNRAPSPAEAREVLRAANPAMDTMPIVTRVWADGPPWFSCKEVIAKFKSPADSAVVRDQLGVWRELLLADWVTLRDTTAGRVVDPGWCTATLLDEPRRTAGGWRAVRGDTMPTGAARRGWDVSAGRQKLVVAAKPQRVGKDSVMVNYALTVAPNVNGTALGADKDSSHHRALLRKEDGSWRVLQADVKEK